MIVPSHWLVAFVTASSACAVSCADGALPSRAANDPANPGAPESPFVASKSGASNGASMTATSSSASAMPSGMPAGMVMP